jgi:hypothetical protein
MNKFEEKELVRKNPNCALSFLSEVELREELKKWKRDDLISWLKWNDPNGIYSDGQSLCELGEILTYEEGVQLIIEQVKG